MMCNVTAQDGGGPSMTRKLSPNVKPNVSPVSATCCSMDSCRKQQHFELFKTFSAIFIISLSKGVSSGGDISAVYNY